MKKGAHELKLRSLKRGCCHTCAGVSALWGDGGKWWLLRLLLQGSGKQQTGFSCCYEKKLPWLGEEVLLGYCTQEKEADSKIPASCQGGANPFFLFQPRHLLCQSEQEEARWRSRNVVCAIPIPASQINIQKSGLGAERAQRAHTQGKFTPIPYYKWMKKTKTSTY